MGARNCIPVNKSPERKVIRTLLQVSGMLVNRTYTKVYRGACDLQTLILPKDTKQLRVYSLTNIRSLQSLKLNPGIKVMGWSVLSHTSLKRLFLPAGIECFGPDVFKDTDMVVFLPEGPTTLTDDLNLNGTGIRRICIPKNVEHIGGNVFHGCLSL